MQGQNLVVADEWPQLLKFSQILRLREPWSKGLPLVCKFSRLCKSGEFHSSAIFWRY